MMRFKLKRNSRWVFDAMAALLMLMILAKFVFGVEIPELAFVGLTVAMVCSGGRNEVLAVMMMCIPLSSVFGTTYTFLAGLITWILRYRDHIRIDLTIVPILLLIIWELLHCLWGSFSIKWFIAQCIPFLLCGLLMWQDSSKVDYGFVVRCLSLCTVTMCLTLLGMVLVQSNFNVSVAFLNMQRLGLAAEGTDDNTLQINPNTLGIICVLAISGLLQLVTTGRGKPTDLIMAVTMMTCGALTTSRTFLLLLLIMVAMLWITQEGSIGKKLRFLLLAAAVGAVVVVVLFMVFPSAIENFIMRLTVNDITSGRTTLLRVYNKFLYANPDVLLFGVGLTDFKNKVVTEYSVAADVPHNGLQEALVAWGIPGFLLFLLFVGTLLWSGKKAAGKQRLLNYIPLLILLAKIQVGQMLTSTYTMLAFSYCYLSLAHCFKQDQQMRAAKRRISQKRLDN